MGFEQRCFSRMCSLFGVPGIDLFASRPNHKDPEYASWKPDPSLLSSMLLLLIGASSRMHMFFHLFYYNYVAKCLQKVMLPQATLIAVLLLW